MITYPKVLGIVIAAFVAGAFIASPELRAYAANTVGSSDIINESILSADLKNGEVKASDIATDAVGAAEIQGVTKLLFGQCKPTSSQATVDVLNGFTLAIDCMISGVDSDDSAFADKNIGNQCFHIDTVDTQSGKVRLLVTNQCGFTSQLGQAEFAVLVYDK
ncbi:MAG TPA: hypothetical protein VIE86_05425 [Nitrososphaera sp.]|jgi:hypothetical protein